MNYSINSEKIIFSQLGSEGVLYDKNDSTYFTLNETTVKILKGIENRTSLETIVHQLCQEYTIDEQACMKEVNTLILELLTKEYIRTQS